MYKIVYKKSSFSEKYYLLTDARFLQGITHDYWKKNAKNWRLEFLSSPAILNRILRLKTQNFAMKSNSENCFTFIQKNSEYYSIPVR